MVTNYQKKILLYLLFGFLIFSIIKVLPNNTLNNFDATIISIIILIISICLEKAITNYTSKHDEINKENFDQSAYELFDKLKDIIDKNKSIDLSSIKNIEKPIEDLKKSLSKSLVSTLISKPSTIIASTTIPINKTKPPTIPITIPITSINSSKTSKLIDPPKSIKPIDPPKSIKPIDPPKSIKPIIKPSKLNIIKPIDTKISSIEYDVEKIKFPFTLQFMRDVFSDMLKIKNDDKNSNIVETKIQMLSKSNEYYEIFIQLIQTNMESVYRYLTEEQFNNLNELIIDVKQRRSNKFIEKEKSVNTKELSPSMNKFLKKMIKQNKYIDNNGFIQNIVDNDMKYSMYSPQDYEKLGTYDSNFTNKWSNDYVLLNTNKWLPPFGHRNHREQAKTAYGGKSCGVCPSITSGYPVRLKDFNLSRKILPPDMINIDYINEKLLTGLP